MTPSTSTLPWFPSAAPGHDERVSFGGHALRLRLYHGAEAPAGARALVLHLHGGSFTEGGLDDGRVGAGALAAAGAVVASLDYPLAPAKPFPHAVEAGHAALGWLARERRRLAGVRAPLVVAGEEAGGNLAAALALMARDRGGPALAGQILVSPMLDASIATASQRQAQAGDAACPCAIGWRAYLADAADALHPYAVPAGSSRLGGLPRTLLVTADDDPLRDETCAYARRLAAAGVDARLHVEPAPSGWARGVRRERPASCAAALRAPLAAFLKDLR